MSRKHVLVTAALATLLAGLGLSGAVVAQTSSSFNLEWHVIGGGGQPASSARYTVNSTAGQGAASPPLSASAHYVVSGGYWHSGWGMRAVYLPLVLRNAP
jgi:hypothetical protein